MTTFLGVPLSKEEELLLTGVIVGMADGNSITEEDVLHVLMDMAQSYNTLTIAKRELKKLKKQTESIADDNTINIGKQQAYNDALDLLE